MLRMFDASRKRETRSLNGFWKFSTDPNDHGTDEEWHSGLPVYQTVSVPSMWNNESGLLTYEGAAWYQKEFYTEGGTLRFCFGGVMTEAAVWLDDTFLGDHYGGFCQFELIATDVAPGTHRLTVRVENSFYDVSVPQKKVDWYHYGGIHRDVSVERLQGVCVLYERLEYTLNDARDAIRGQFVLSLYNAQATACTSRLCIRLGEQTVYEGTVTLEGGIETEWRSPAFDMQNIRLWDPNDPQLYDISIETDTDGLCDRTGFRLVEVKDERVCINGRPVELRGVNRHEEHPDWGFAFPPKLMKKDLDIIEDMGCNTVRGSHYPNSQVFVDMLDDRGLLFWSEIPIWGCGFSQEALGDPVVLERGLEMHREMLKYYYNHPSIIIWGMHNEILTNTPEGVEMSRQYYGFLKEQGGNRLVTYASHKPLEDNCFDYCDLMCLNMYFGWYSGTVESWDRFMEQFRDLREALGMTHKPVIISEFGAAALYGQHTFDDIPWTEEYQERLIAHCLELFHEDPMVGGFYVWQFSDIRTCAQMGLNRARGFNNKGLVNEYRKPKSAYFAVKRLYHDFAKKG